MIAVVVAVFFTTPAATAATLAGVVAIPIVVHLFNRRRYQVVDWAAMRFLQAAVKRTTQRMRLEQWLLLLVRTLLIALPALAMAASMSWADPTWERMFPGSALSPRRWGRTHHVLVIDGSLSMTARQDAASPFEKAQSLAAELVRSSPGGDAFSVIMLAGTPRGIVPGPADDPEKVAREIDAMRCIDVPADVALGIQLADEVLKRGSTKFAHRAIYIFTDLQRSQWAAPATPTGTWAEDWRRLHERADVAIVDVGFGPPENLAISSVELADSVITTGTQSALTCTIHNHGKSERKQVRAELWQSKLSSTGSSGSRDDPYAAHVVRQELVDLSANTAATLSFPVEFRGPGDYVLEVRLEADALYADNRRAIPVTVRDTLPVLLVNGRPARERLNTATGWLATALDPSEDGQRSGRYPARPRVIDESRFGDAELRLEDYDCVYYCDVARPGPRDAERLDGYVRRGGTVVFTLGPNVDPEAYNRLLFRGGDGVLPAKLLARARSRDDEFFHITADDEAFRRPPLAAFSADDDRASLLAARFKEYWRVEPAEKVSVERLLKFVPPATHGDAVIYQWSRGRGRVVLFTSTVNTDWTGWPVSPSFLPFVQELLRATARQPQRREFSVGEAINEFLPDGIVAADAKVTSPDRGSVTVPLVTGDESPRLHFTETDRSGLYRAEIAGLPPRDYAVNVRPGESDLARLGPNELPMTGTGEEPQVIAEPNQIRFRPTASPIAESAESPAGTSGIGAKVARVLLLIVLVLLLVEPFMAWRLGSAREPRNASDRQASSRVRQFVDIGIALMSLGSLLVAATFGLALLCAAAGGQLLEVMPGFVRDHVEQWLEVPAPVAGETARWSMDRLPVFTSHSTSDRWAVGIVGALTLLFAGWVYHREMKRTSRVAGWPLAALRFATVILALTVLLPQLRLVLEREVWPDVVVLIDNSQSMGTTDNHSDAATAKVVSELSSSTSATRLQLAQAMLTRPNNGWLAELISRRQTHVHAYSIADRAAHLGKIDNIQQVGPVSESIRGLQATGTSSRLGDAVNGVLQEFRGSSLAGIIFLSDGITTDGNDLASAGQNAKRAAVPLVMVGIGDASEPRDVALSDLRVDDVVRVGDRLIFEAKLATRGMPTQSLSVTLCEKRDSGLKELARTEIVADPLSSLAKIRLTHTQTEPGEKIYVLQVEQQPGESDTSNNRLERNVLVSEFRRTRVLLIDGRPRYDFRAIKTLFERESEAIRGNKSVELKVLLCDADAEYSRQDRSAMDGFPSSKEELLSRFDVIILGDVDPKHPFFGEKQLQWLADFVIERGGGILFELGPSFSPAAWRQTPLAKLLPVEITADAPILVVRLNGYRPRLTGIGRSHPALRFAPEESENIETWSKLRPFFWAATGIKAKPSAEVLAELPPDDATTAATPLILQQFVGSGRVLLLGFDETWRWRYRNDETSFNQFWLQAVRYLAKSRASRPEVRLDRQTPYRRGEPIRVSVQFPDDKPPPAADVPAKVQLERLAANGDIERQTLILAHVAGTRATFETLFTRTPEGIYTFTLDQPDGESGRPSNAFARVIAPPGEMDRLQLNRHDMERAAQASRGRFYTMADAHRLVDDLPASPRMTLQQSQPPRPLWNTPLVFLTTIGLVAAEWILRKRHGLL